MPKAEHGGGGSARGERAGASKGEKSGKGEKSAPEKNTGGRKEGGNREGKSGGGGKAGGGESRGRPDVDRGNRGGERSGRESGSSKGGGTREKAEAKQKSGSERVGKGRSSENTRNTSRPDKPGSNAGGRQPVDSRSNRATGNERRTSAQPDRTQGAKKQSDRKTEIINKSNRAREFANLPKSKQESDLERAKLARDLGSRSVSVRNLKDGSTNISTSDGKGRETNFRVFKDGTVQISEKEKGWVKETFVKGDKVYPGVDRLLVEQKTETQNPRSKERTKLTFFEPLDLSFTPQRQGSNSNAGTKAAPPREKERTVPISGPKTIESKPEKGPQDSRFREVRDRPEKATTPAVQESRSAKSPQPNLDFLRSPPTHFNRPARPERSNPPLSNAPKSAVAETNNDDRLDNAVDVMRKSALGLAVGLIGVAAFPGLLASGTALAGLTIALEVIDLAASFGGLTAGGIAYFTGVGFSDKESEYIDAGLSGGKGLVFGAGAAVVCGQEGFLTVASAIGDADEVKDMENLAHVGAGKDLIRFTQGIRAMIAIAERAKKDKQKDPNKSVEMMIFPLAP